LRRSGATLALDEPVLDLRRTDAGFTLTTPHRVVSAARVILTSGGQSYPGSGTIGDGYRFAAQFGHTIVTPQPALVPLTVAAPWVPELRGITLPDVALRVLDGSTSLTNRRGSLLFAHFGLSGPAVLDVSRAVSKHARPDSIVLEVDFVPAMKEAALDDYLRTETVTSGKKQLAVVLAAHLPRRLCDTLLALAGLPIDRKAVALSKVDRAKLVAGVKRLRLPITGTLGFKKAEVTTGGVSLDEVDSRTMRSKLVAGLWIAGEVLDVDGPIGGYNFQGAFSTGWLAAQDI
jgi:predicted Rossmann fold flavoprotein